MMPNNDEELFDIGIDDEEGDDLTYLLEEERTVFIERAQYSIYEIFRKYNRGDLILKPFYQRNAVWKNPKKSKLIESVIRNIPIPSIYLAELESGQLEVIDGQQRLRAFFDFFKGKYQLSSLPVLTKLNRLHFKQLDNVHQRKIEDYQLHIFVIKKNSHPDIRFDIFERINEGATQLNAQELRNSMYRDGENEFLRQLSKEPAFIKLTKGKLSDLRLKDQEAVLRFLSFRKKGYLAYRGNMNAFLNDTMEHFFDYFPKEIHAEVHSHFVETMQLIKMVLGTNAFMKNGTNVINMSLFDVICYSFSIIPKEKIVAKQKDIRQLYEVFLEDNVEFIRAISTNTLAKKTVECRFSIWMEKIQELLEG